MTERPHVEAFRALLVAAPDPLTVYVSQSPNFAAVPYVVLHPSMPEPDGEKVCGTTGRRNNYVQTTCVGESTEQTQWLAEHVEARVLEKRPTIAGRTCGLIHKEYSRPADRDDDVTPPLFTAVDGWYFTATA